jgi:hypothetical protein
MAKNNMPNPATPTEIGTIFELSILKKMRD